MSQPTETLALFAVTAPGLEAVAAEELSRLGIQGRVEPGGVAWEGTAESLYQANLQMRTASRVLVRVAEFRARTFFELERHAQRVPWERFVGRGGEAALRVTCRKSRLYHQGAVAERLAAGIESRAGGRAAAAGREEGEEEGLAEQLFVVRFLHDRATISADASGALLHLRGYRQAVAKAPLRETLAAALLEASGWRGQAPLLDPMCGSGTVAIEAALTARQIAPGLANPRLEPRRFAMLNWPEFDPAIWAQVVDRARARVRPEAGVAIRGSDRDAGAIDAARANAERAGVSGDVEWSVRPLSAAEPADPPGWLATNPPYGVRVGEAAGLRNLYAALGRLASHRLQGWTLALLSADRALEAQLRIPLEERVRTRNGGIPVRVVVGRVPDGGSTADST